MPRVRKLIKIMLRKLFEKIMDETGSPLVEEGLLIGLAIAVFITIAMIVSNLMSWLNQMAENLPGFI
mgnify:FL=1